MTTATAPAPAQQANVPAKSANNPARQFRTLASNIAGSLLKDWVGEQRAGEATGRISAALAASAAAAKNPRDFYDCTVESIGQCIAVAALTEIMPGTGSAALAYVVPQRPRANERPQLQFMFSHRGLNALARRTGQTMIATPIGHQDKIAFDDAGEIRVIDRDIDNPPTTENDLRGVIVAVREIANGNTICRGWVPKKLIDERKAISRSASSSYSPWAKWYVEMAMKTAMHYAISRGWCVIDDAAATRALSAEQAQDLVIVDAKPRALPDDRAATDALADELESRIAEPTTDTESEPVSDNPDMAGDSQSSAAYKELFDEIATSTAPTPEFLDLLEANIREADLLPGEADQLLAILNTKRGDVPPKKSRSSSK